MPERGAVAAGHPLTAAIARSLLREGGNAFDAALGALCGACVAEPVLASLGGGGFLLASSARHGECLYDFFVQTPRRRRPAAEIDFHPVTVDFGSAHQQFHIGQGAVATPGLVRGLFAVHADLGHMPLGEVVAPALELAREGAELNPLQAYILSVVAPIFTATQSARGQYTGAGGRLLQAGERLRMPQWADLLETLALEGEALFYEGEIAALIAAQAQSGGGHLQTEDLRAYQAVRRAPLRTDCAGASLLSNPPPSSGGILIAFALQLLAQPGIELAGAGECAYWRHLARAMALTDQAREQQLTAPEALLDPQLLQRYRREIAGRGRALRGTTHISVMDGAGNAAGLSVSNGEGCGALLPGTGVMLNNMLGEDDLHPGGFEAWQPDQRLTSMMAPSLLLEHSRGRRVVLGSGGSNRIRTAILQVLLNLTLFDLPAEEAVARPRIHCEDGLLNIEQGEAAALQPLLEEWPRHRLWPARNMFFGGVHCVAECDGRFSGAGDERRGGCFLRA